MRPILASSAVVEPVFVMLGLVLAAAVVVALVFVRFRQSLILGYFLCGIVLANSGIIDRLGFAQTDVVFATLADTGVILLMFTLGIEFSFTELRKLHRQALGGGGLQVGVTVLAGTLAAVGLAMVGWMVGGLLGFMVALSSTALALKLFQEAGQSTGPGARLALGIALCQDVAVVAAIIVIPALFHGGGSGAVLPALGSAVGRGILFCGGVRFGIAVSPRRRPVRLAHGRQDSIAEQALQRPAARHHHLADIPAGWSTPWPSIASTPSSTSPSAGGSSSPAARSTGVRGPRGTTAPWVSSSRRTCVGSGGARWCRAATTSSGSTPRSSWLPRCGRPPGTPTSSPI